MLLIRFGIANQCGTKLAPELGGPFFDTSLVTLDGRARSSVNEEGVFADAAMLDGGVFDLVIVPPVLAGTPAALERDWETVAWVRRQHAAGATIASIASGTYFSAHAGILNGRRAAVGMSAVEPFVERYPLVNILAGASLIDDGDVVTAAGVPMAHLQMIRHLTRRYCGVEVLHHCHSVLTMCSGSGQDPLPIGVVQKQRDDDIERITSWIRANPKTMITNEALAGRFGMSARTLLRRFKAATSMTPGAFSQQVRIDLAKRMLVTERTRVAAVAAAVGYGDGRSFSRAFRQLTGMSPLDYRRRRTRARDNASSDSDDTSSASV